MAAIPRPVLYPHLGLGAPADGPAHTAWGLMVSLVTEQQAAFMRAASELDLQTLEALALVVAVPGRDVSMGVLAGHLGLTRSHATRIVDALEARGLVERRFGAADRRVRLVRLTEAGRNRRTSLAAAALEPPAMLRSMTGEEEDHLVALLSGAPH